MLDDLVMILRTAAIVVVLRLLLVVLVVGEIPVVHGKLPLAVVVQAVTVSPGGGRRGRRGGGSGCGRRALLRYG